METTKRLLSLLLALVTLCSVIAIPAFAASTWPSLSSSGYCEMISPGKVGRGFDADTLRNEKGEDIESAPHPGMIFRLKVPFPVMEGDILRGGDVR